MKKSKIGIAFALIYLIATIIVAIYAYTCSEMYCGLIMLAPVMPWALLLEGVLDDTIFVFFILIALNSVIVYSLGWLISLILKKTKFFHSS